MRLMIVVLGLLMSLTIQARPKLNEDLKLECSVAFPDAPIAIDGLYQIWRYGDTLFARYRHAPERELLQTDDVVVKRLSKEEFVQEFGHELYQRVLTAADVSSALVNQVHFYGVDEISSGQFEMKLYHLLTVGGVAIGKAAHHQHDQVDDIRRCR